MDHKNLNRRKFNNRRHRFNQNRNFQHSQGESDAAASSSQSNSFKRRPPGLRGREIGMYYANKRKTEPNRPIGTIYLSDSKKCQIKLLLNNIKKHSTTKTLSDNDSCYDNIEESEFKTEFLKIISGSIEEKLNDESLCKTLERNSILDNKYYDELNKTRTNNFRYKAILPIRKKLPSYVMRDELVNLINQNQIVVISGETGCGKTTQVPQFILDEFITAKKGSLCKIVCTQPRRISAISVAERVAQERGEICGNDSVGYHIRLERKFPRSTGSIVFCTTGILLKQMESDPLLSNISHLILDEIHERDVVSDFIITILKQIITKRTDLKLILMSATLNAEQFSKYFSNCATINIPGFTYPVKEFYLEDVLSLVDFNFPSDTQTTNWRRHVKKEKEKQKSRNEFTDFVEPYIRNLRRTNEYSSRVVNNLANPNSEKINIELMAKLIIHISTKKDDGSILVFLPGIADLFKLSTELNKSEYSSQYIIILLHSKLPSIEQKRVFNRPPTGMRKIVIATNIAETSITIDDIIYVIDCGKIKMTTYDVENDVENLQPEWVSLANASQRRGRAGRVQAGICYHLFTKVRQNILESYQMPEVQRCKLENIILNIKILQLGKAEEFLNRLMDPPHPQAIENGLKLLRHINALDDQERLTPLGYHLAKLPVNPRVGKMILLGALFSCLDPILSIAASLDFKDAFQIPMEKQKSADEKKRELANGLKSDHLMLAEAIRRYEIAKNNHNERRFCWDYYLSSYTLELLINMKKQFAEYLHEMRFLTNSDVKSPQWNQNSENVSLIKAIVCAGLYPNVAIIKKVNIRGNKSIHTTEQEKVHIHLNSVNEKETIFESPLLVYHLKLKTVMLYIHDTTMIHSLPLVFFGDEIKIEQHNEKRLISLSNILRFICTGDTAVLIKQLRNNLDNLLKYKIAHPGIVDWTNENNEVAVLRAIMELITSEDIGEYDFEDEEFDTSYAN